MGLSNSSLRFFATFLARAATVSASGFFFSACFLSFLAASWFFFAVFYCALSFFSCARNFLFACPVSLGWDDFCEELLCGTFRSA